MKFKTLLGAALLASRMLAAGAANAKSLVYCSEGSPENFTPSINTTGTSFDAACPVYNRLVQFTPGTTQVEAALAEHGGGNPMAIWIGNILDAIPGSLVIGATFVGFAKFNPTLLIAIFLANLPEAMASAHTIVFDQGKRLFCLHAK